MQFLPPSWEAPLDVGAYLAATPAHATSKGMFTAALVTEAKRRGIALKHARDHYVAFKDYPMAEHMQVLCEASRAFFPGLPLRRGLRALGRDAYATFNNSMIGKVTLDSASDIPSALRVTAKGFGIGMTLARVEV